MKPLLEITYRKGRPLAAYLYLPRRPGDRSVRTVRQDACLLLDYAPGDRAIGIEITAPGQVTLEAVNRVLAMVHQDPVTEQDLAPLVAMRVAS